MSASCGSSTPSPGGSCESTRAMPSCGAASPRLPPPSGKALQSSFASAGVGHVALSTDGDWLRPLAAFLRRGKRVR